MGRVGRFVFVQSRRVLNTAEISMVTAFSPALRAHVGVVEDGEMEEGNLICEECGEGVDGTGFFVEIKGEEYGPLCQECYDSQKESSKHE